MEREESWANPMPFGELTQNLLFRNQPFAASNLQQYEPNWEESVALDYGAKVESLFSNFNPSSGNLSSLAGCSNDHKKSLSVEDGLQREIRQDSKVHDWDPTAMLNNLSFLKQKILQMQDLVQVIAECKGQDSVSTHELVRQQQLITVDLTSVIIQLVSTAGCLLSANSSIGQLNGALFPPTMSSAADLLPQRNGGPVQQNTSDVEPLVQCNQLDPTSDHGEMEQNYNLMDIHDLKDEEDPIDEEHLTPGSFVILQMEKQEILAPRAHFCTKCGKGFKRDANLRMHMRGHGDEYKTPAALSKPHKGSGESELVTLKRYSCPYIGCKRNKDHKSFQPLKTILCVRNHYKRSHCVKNYTCSRCNNKKFSVLADLKTHEKHCGKDKWLCSCGNTFSRKDKLFGHMALFQGHTPAIQLEASASSIPVENSVASDNKVGSMAFSFGSDNSNEDGMKMQGNMDGTYFSAFSLMGSPQDFLQSTFDDSGASFPFLINGLQSGTGDDE